MQAQTVLDSISQSDAEWRRDRDYWDAVATENSIRNQARKEGFCEGVRQNAKNFKQKGIAPELIAECTGLSIAEINAL